MRNSPISTVDRIKEAAAARLKTEAAASANLISEAAALQPWIILHSLAY